MKFSLLLTGLAQRLAFVALILAGLWGVYFWAVANDQPPMLNNNTPSEITTP